MCMLCELQLFVDHRALETDSTTRVPNAESFQRTPPATNAITVTASAALWTNVRNALEGLGARSSWLRRRKSKERKHILSRFEVNGRERGATYAEMVSGFSRVCRQSFRTKSAVPRNTRAPVMSIATSHAEDVLEGSKDWCHSSSTAVTSVMKRANTAHRSRATLIE